jgi:hypothetical protein
MLRILITGLSLCHMFTVGCVASGSGTGGGDNQDVASPELDAAQGGDTSLEDTLLSSDASAPPTDAVPAPDDSTAPPSDAGTQPSSGCMADHFLDVTNQAGAGGNYDKATVSATCEGDVMIVSSNGMPHYEFVSMTPNPLVPVAFDAELPINPEVAAQNTDIALLGTIGVAVNGAVFYGPNEGEFPDPYGDPQLNAITDGCWGHTANAYHYHALRDECLSPDSLIAQPWTNPAPDASKPSPVLGFALDGFPVYGPNGCMDEACTSVSRMKSSWEAIEYEKIGCDSDADCGNGFQCGKAIVDGEEVQICGSETYAWDKNECTKDTCTEGQGEWLDECNGRFGPDGTYRYHATDTFPYILGCYRGTPINVGGGGPGRGGNGPGNGGNGAGPADCTSDADCTDACPEGSKDCGCVTLQGGPAAGQQKCVPLCDSDADCPAAPMGGQMTCSPEGTCVPPMGG